MEYLDFELRIGPGTGGEYPLSVLRSPAGEAAGVMRFPFDALALQNRLQAVEIAVLRSSGTRRDIVRAGGPQPVADFGRELFECLMCDAVRESFRRSQDRARAAGKGLRLRLRIDDPALAALPWEYLYDSSEGDYVCLSSDTPLVRYLEFDRPPEALTVQPPLAILGVIASPADRATLDVARERQRMEAATEAMRDAGQLELTWLEGSTWRDLQRAMRRGPYHILHFVGHGGYDAAAGEGVVALADDAGQSALLTATQLGRLLADHDSLRLVVLNSCLGARGSGADVFSSTASMLIRRGVPAVVAMQFEISDRAAVEFARALYEALADGMPIDAAVGEARKAISLASSDTVEWGTPVLHMRAPDGVLFRFDAAAAPATPRRTERPPRIPPPVADPDVEPAANAPPPGPTLEEQVRDLRGRLLLTSGLSELQTLWHEVDALRAAHPLDVGVRRLHEQVAEARAAAEPPAPARSGAPAPGAPARGGGRRSARWLAGGLSTLTAAALLIVVMRRTDADADLGLPDDVSAAAPSLDTASLPSDPPPPPPPPPPDLVEPTPATTTAARPRPGRAGAPAAARPTGAASGPSSPRAITALPGASVLPFAPSRARVRTVDFTTARDGGWELRLRVEREIDARALRLTVACRLGPAAGADERVVRIPIALPVGATSGDFVGRFQLERPWPRGEHPISCTAPQPTGPVTAWEGRLAVR
jgi:hypothetical protein